MSPEMFDVAVVGAGPVGSTAANIAAEHGLTSVLIDESVEVFALPRAIHFDADIMRIFQFAGLAGRIEPLTRATTGGVHLGLDGEPIRRFRVPDRAGDLGWRPHYMFFQPELDALLRSAASKRPEVMARFGWRCTALSQGDDGVTLTLMEPAGGREEVRARYVLAADGAASSVRTWLGLELDDYGFDEPWIIVDAEVTDADLGPDYTIMYCDPARPATYVPGPGRHRRWEFMLLPGETGSELSTLEGARGLVDGVTPWLRDVELTVRRTAVYRFHALVARSWRAGRVFLCGDAAHQTPPFYGQGMCHGLRDVRNLLWKIAAIRHDLADESLLDSYQLEREPHVRAVIEAAVTNGRYICTLDPEVAARRDRELRERMDRGADVRSFREVIPGLRTGVIDKASDSEATGLLFVQPSLVVDGDRPRLLDDLVGDRFTLVSGVPVPDGPDVVAWTQKLGGRVIEIGESITDPEELVPRWCDAFGCVAAVIRPDRYVYGVAATAEDIDGLLARCLGDVTSAEAAIVAERL